MNQDVATDAPAAVLPSTCTLYQEDCLNVLPQLTPNSVGMVFADLPYGSTQNKWDSHLNPAAFWAALQPSTLLNAAKILTADYRFGIIIAAANLKHFRYDLIWDKVNRASGFLNANRMPLRLHEHCLVFYERQPTYNPVFTKSTPYAVSPPQAKTRSKSYGDHKIKGLRLSDGRRHPVSVLRIERDRCRPAKHPTQKPVALLEWLIRTYTNPGDTVLDPVFGSCTTGVACARLGRHFIGIEKDPEYFRIGRERVDAERTKLGLQPCEIFI